MFLLNKMKEVVDQETVKIKVVNIKTTPIATHRQIITQSIVYINLTVLSFIMSWVVVYNYFLGKDINDTSMIQFLSWLICTPLSIMLITGCLSCFWFNQAKLYRSNLFSEFRHLFGSLCRYRRCC